MVGGVDLKTALDIYKSTAERAVPKVNQAAEDGDGLGVAGENFGNVLGKITDNAVAAGKQSEVMSMKAITGEADIRDVVTAVANAEVALDTVVSVRDRAITAYQEIMKMPI